MKDSGEAKKMLIINILRILEKYSDENHKLTQQQILEYLKKDYDMIAERKSIKRNIDDLVDAGYDINYSETERGQGKNKNIVTSDYFIIRDFEDSELRLLIDSLIFAKNIPYAQQKKLIQKLEGLSNTYFKSRVKYIELPRENELLNAKENRKSNDDLFLNIEVIDEAIAKNKKITFKYCSYNKNISLEPRKNRDGKGDRIYKATPFQMVATSGRYYLVCAFDSHEDFISNIRLDKIKDIKLTEERGSQKEATQKKLKNLTNNLLESVYMFSGDSIYVDFKFKKDHINNVVDVFGKNIRIYEEKGDKENYYVSTKVNPRSMKMLAMQYGDFITVEAPKSLVKEIKDLIKDMQKRYK